MNWFGKFFGSFSSVAKDAPAIKMVFLRLSSGFMVFEKPVESP